MKTFSATPKDIEKSWILIDADGLVVGRLAALIATRLRGKHKASYTPHMDCGDNIVVINAGNVVLTGNKRADKVYHWHTGYPGGIKSESYGELLARKPADAIRKTVKGMLPKGPLGRQMITKLKVYAGPDHPHAAQTPQPLDLSAARAR